MTADIDMILYPLGVLEYLYRNRLSHTVTPSGTEYIYHYYVTDRQGNVRAVVRDGNLVEANDYYPYGMLMADAEGKIPDKQPYKLSGKEYITTRGLNLYDFGARMHDPAAMRFSTPDPLMEQYPSLSPYTYCAANPNKYFDLYGLKTYRIDDSGNLISTEENDEEDKIIIIKDNKEVAIHRMGGVYIEENYRNSYDYTDSSDNTRHRGFFDYYRIRGDENAKELFLFLANNTNAEWSLALTGEASNGLCFLSTSFLINAEPGMSMLLLNQLYHGYYIRELYHNHTYKSDSNKPSPNDYNFAQNTNARYTGSGFWYCNNDILFFLALPKVRYDYLIKFWPATKN